MNFRYVKLNRHEPGVRYDVLLGRDVYSSRFLNNEERGPRLTRIEDIWVSLYCFFTGTFVELVEVFFMAVGIAATIIFFILLANGVITLGG